MHWHRNLILLTARILAAGVISLTLSFLASAILAMVFNWPPFSLDLARIFGAGSGQTPTEEDRSTAMTSVFILLIYVAPIALLVLSAFLGRGSSLEREATYYARLAAYVVRAGFWSVFLIGLFDATISFLRVEALLASVLGDPLAAQLGLAQYRALAVHIPLLAISCLIAAFTRSVSVVWLSLLVVLSEFAIVIARFVFSYEQVFMGDLVRFWYSALFLLAASYCLAKDEHVRVDIYYTKYSARGKALANAIGTLVLGLPFLWTILIMGLGGKSSSLSSALRTFEISQSGFGMYVKYLMAGLLIVFALSMIAQMMALFLHNVETFLAERPNSTTRNGGRTRAAAAQP